MSLDQRMERARCDYRALEAPEPATVRIDTGRGGRRGAGPWALAAAAIVLVLAIAGVVVGRDAGPEVTTQEPTTSPAGEVVSGDVVLVPAGPYHDQQEIAVRLGDGVPAASEVGEVRQCVAAETSEDGGPPTPICEPGLDQVLVGTDGDDLLLRLAARPFTALGEADCTLVPCRIEVETAEGTLRSGPLAFIAGGPSTGPSLAVSTTATAGTYSVLAEGAVPDATWVAAQREDPQTLSTLAPFTLQVCAFAPSGQVEPPFPAAQPWGPPSDAGTPCTALPEGVLLDPASLDAPHEVTVPPLVFQFGSWASCAAQPCYLVLSQRVAVELKGDGAIGAGDQTVARAVLPVDGPWPEPALPALTVETDGPHVGGEDVEITITGVPQGAEAQVMACRLDDAQGGAGICGEALPEAQGLADGTHQATLPAAVLDDCPPERCYLELAGGVDGHHVPWATAPLVTTG